MKRLVTDTSWCKGCGICAAFCPRGVLKIVNDKVFVENEENCIRCGQCELRCPDYAIWLEDKDNE